MLKGEPRCKSLRYFLGYDGPRCEDNIDDCRGINCNHGTCEDGVDEFTCRCDTGNVSDQLIELVN